MSRTNCKALIRWSYRKFDKWYPRPENFTSARPRIYLWFGTYIEMFKVPDAVYDLYIRVAHWPTELSTDGQTSDFQEKDELLVTAGVMETYLALEEYVDAKVWGNKFAGNRYLETGAIGGMLRDTICADDADIDWEPEAEPGRSIPEYMSGTPYSDPYGSQGDPLYGYGD